MNVITDANSVDPDQTDPIDLRLYCLTKRLLKHFSRREKQTTDTLRVNRGKYLEADQTA